MRHNLSIDGGEFRLRPVEMDDAAFILDLRADPVRARYLHPITGGLPAQQRWLAEYFERPGDYYFVIENRATGRREGAAGIYNLDPLAGTAEWGRWIVRPGSLAAAESACLIYRVGFELLALESVYCRTIAENAPALAFHDSFGVQRERILADYFELDGRRLDAVEGRLTRAGWESLPLRVASVLKRGTGYSVHSHHAG